MSAARVIHFGQDECYRTPILRGAGYDVEQCTSIPELQQALKADDDAELICISESYEQPREDALATSRALSSAPVVLFRSTAHRYMADSFDLEIDPLDSPEVWLVHMGSLIDRSRAIRHASKELVARSRKLGAESAAEVARSRDLRARIADQRNKKE
jgi:hypothetical protein